MKTFELKVYRPIPERPPASDFGFAYEDWNEDRSIERQKMLEKRLNLSELSAETYRQMIRAIGESGMVKDADNNVAPGDAAVFGPVREETYRLGVLKRFAMLEHASVKDYR